MTALVRGISDLGVPARRGITLLSDIPDRQCPPSRPPTPSQVKQAEGQAAGEPEGCRPASIWQKNGCGPAQSCCRQWARSRATTATMRLSRVRASLLRLHPRGLHDVPHGIHRGLLLQGPRRLPVLQWSPHGPDCRPPRRSRHPAGARAAVGDLGAEAEALTLAIAGHARRPASSRRGAHEDLP
jgi:hypothetical protein